MKIDLWVYSRYMNTSYLVHFSNEQQALDFVDLNWNTHDFQETELWPIPNEATRLLNRLYPTCEHGLSADLCEGPEHYPVDSPW